MSLSQCSQFFRRAKNGRFLSKIWALDGRKDGLGSSFARLLKGSLWGQVLCTFAMSHCCCTVFNQGYDPVGAKGDIFGDSSQRVLQGKGWRCHGSGTAYIHSFDEYILILHVLRWSRAKTIGQATPSSSSQTRTWRWPWPSVCSSSQTRGEATWEAWC